MIKHDPRCISLTESEFNTHCDCSTLRMIDSTRAASNTVRIERVSKSSFEKAFKNGERVAVVKDPNYWKSYDQRIGSTLDVPGPVGFTNATAHLEDIYCDGPSRPGEAFRFWIVTEIPHEP